MGYNDARRFPDFSYISKTGKFNTAIDCVIITHLYVFFFLFHFIVRFKYNINLFF